jgi:hypothetical protein
MRISLIHALHESAAPINEAFARLWPGAELRNILDDSLAADLERAGVLDERMTQRFLALGRYAIHGGTDAILFTCSAFGPCIDAVAADLAPLPVRKPTSAMVAEAVAHGGRLGLIASFGKRVLTTPDAAVRDLAHAFNVVGNTHDPHSA